MVEGEKTFLSLCAYENWRGMREKVRESAERKKRVLRKFMLLSSSRLQLHTTFLPTKKRWAYPSDHTQDHPVFLKSMATLPHPPPNKRTHRYWDAPSTSLPHLHLVCHHHISLRVWKFKIPLPPRAKTSSRLWAKTIPHHFPEHSTLVRFLQSLCTEPFQLHSKNK